MWYAIYESATGALRSLGTVVAEPLPPGLQAKPVGAERPSGEWNQQTLAFAPRSGLPDHWTKYEFLDRMTAVERKVIRAFAKEDADAEDFMDMLNVSGEVVRSNPAVLAGLLYFESKGKLAAGRAQEILNG